MRSVNSFRVIRRISHRISNLIRQALAIEIMLVLAFPMAPAQAVVLSNRASAAWKNAVSYLGEVFSPISKGSVKSKARQPFSAVTQAQQVAYIQFCPRKLILFVGESQAVTPLAMSSTQQVVHGASINYNSLNASIATVTSYGEVQARSVGTTSVEVGCETATMPITIEVREGTRPVGSNIVSDLDTEDGCAAEQATVYTEQPSEPTSPPSEPTSPPSEPTPPPSKPTPPVSKPTPPRQLPPATTLQTSAATSEATTSSSVRLDQGGDPVGIPSSRAASFDNAVGNPRFSPQDQTGAGSVLTSTQLGSNNYQFSAPVVSFGGRGMALGLSMTYNSRVWNRDDTSIIYN
ncbi:MAG: Ig-like domain-containing protein, partial [Pyrinomonadaceae bacterium]